MWGKNIGNITLVLSCYGFEIEPAFLEVKLEARIIKGMESMGDTKIAREKF
jgi:hypothetical protein